MPSQTVQTVSRRRTLGLLALFGGSGLTGCFSPQMGGPVSQLSLYNGTEQSVTVSIDVHRLPSEEAVLADTVTLAPESGRDYADPFTEDGRKRLAIVADGDRRESYEWQTTADANSSGVSINIYRDEIRIRQIAA